MTTNLDPVQFKWFITKMAKTQRRCVETGKGQNLRESKQGNKSNREQARIQKPRKVQEKQNKGLKTLGNPGWTIWPLLRRTAKDWGKNRLQHSREGRLMGDRWNSSKITKVGKHTKAGSKTNQDLCGEGKKGQSKSPGSYFSHNATWLCVLIRPSVINIHMFQALQPLFLC